MDVVNSSLMLLACLLRELQRGERLQIARLSFSIGRLYFLTRGVTAMPTGLGLPAIVENGDDWPFL
jgi:hypothetical protein